MKRALSAALIALSLLALTVGQAWAEKSQIAVFSSADIPYYNEIVDAFSRSMDADGFLQKGGKQLIIQKPNPDNVAWHNTARKLATMDVGLIVAIGASAATHTAGETSTIPIVYVAVDDPDAIGLSAPNITGVTAKVPVAALVEVMKKTSPFATPGFIYSRSEPGTIAQAKEFKLGEKSSGYTGNFANIDDKGSVDKLSGIDALVVSASCIAYQQSSAIIAKARALKVVSASFLTGLEDKGMIYSMAADPAEQGEKAAGMVKKVLSGTPPKNIPAEKVSKINTIVNLKEAKSLGLKIPFEVLTGASKVIQ